MKSTIKERKVVHITQGKDTEVPVNLQTTLLDEHHFLSGLVQGCLQELIKREFDRCINARPHQQSADRRGIRNGSCTRCFKTRVGRLELISYRDRLGQFRSGFFNRYQRSEQAFMASMLEMYLQGISTRKVSKIIATLCGTAVSRSQVSELTKRLDTQLDA